jgi:hypothetical protein
VHRLDEAIVAFLLAQHAANLADRLNEVVLRHRRVPPHGVQQLLLAYEPQRIGDEYGERLDLGRRQVHALTVAVQRVPARVENERPEAK